MTWYCVGAIPPTALEGKPLAGCNAGFTPRMTRSNGESRVASVANVHCCVVNIPFVNPKLESVESSVTYTPCVLVPAPSLLISMNLVPGGNGGEHGNTVLTVIVVRMLPAVPIVPLGRVIVSLILNPYPGP